MAWLRHSTRHVQQTLLDHVNTQLTALNWTVSGQTPFGAPVVELVAKPIVDGDHVRENASAGKVFVTLGDESNPEDEEMGGPLAMQPIPFFFDVFMDESAHALALANDIRDILRGRIGGKRYLDVVNQVTGVPEPGWNFEMCEIERVTPAQRFALHWQVVKVTCEVHYQEEVW